MVNSIMLKLEREEFILNDLSTLFHVEHDRGNNYTCVTFEMGSLYFSFNTLNWYLVLAKTELHLSYVYVWLTVLSVKLITTPHCECPPLLIFS